jgi:hypothetical protein
MVGLGKEAMGRYGEKNQGSALMEINIIYRNVDGQSVAKQRLGKQT